MKQLVSDAFTYHSGALQYSWPLETGKLKMYFSGDVDLRVYLCNSHVEDCYFPLFTGSSYSRELNIVGFDLLIVKTRKKSDQLAASVEILSAAALDPCDYTPREILPPMEKQERTMMEIVIAQKLREMGLDPEQLASPVLDPDDDGEDLDFFDDEETGTTQYSDRDPAEQLQAEEPPETPQPEDTSSEQTPDTPETPPSGTEDGSETGE